MRNEKMRRDIDFFMQSEFIKTVLNDFTNLNCIYTLKNIQNGYLFVVNGIKTVERKAHPYIFKITAEFQTIEVQL
jgi:hypothetical protein